MKRPTLSKAETVERVKALASRMKSEGDKYETETLANALQYMAAACCCGDSSSLGVVHRADGPCFYHTPIKLDIKPGG